MDQGLEEEELPGRCGVVWLMWLPTGRVEDKHNCVCVSISIYLCSIQPLQSVQRLCLADLYSAFPQMLTLSSKLETCENTAGMAYLTTLQLDKYFTRQTKDNFRGATQNTGFVSVCALLSAVLHQHLLSTAKILFRLSR